MIVKKEFYFLRHGQTDYNISDRKVDYEDISLNAVGFKQAQEVEPIVAKLPIKSVCFSPLKRAKETKEKVILRLQVSEYEISELEECSRQVWNDMISSGKRAYESSYPHVVNFMQRALNGIDKALSYDEPVLIVAHGGIHWAFCCLMGIEEHEWSIDNCIPVHFFKETQGRWKAQKLM